MTEIHNKFRKVYDVYRKLSLSTKVALCYYMFNLDEIPSEILEDEELSEMLVVLAKEDFGIEW